MLLCKERGNEQIMGLVSSVMGMGGIAGGLLVANREDKGKTGEDDLSVRRFFPSCSGIWGSAWAGCLELVPGRACGKRSYSLCSRGTAYYSVSPGSPGDTGKNFAARNALQYCSIPAGLLLGGWLADYVFEPFMQGIGCGTAAWQIGWDRERKWNGADVPVHRRAWDNVKPFIGIATGKYGSWRKGWSDSAL